MCAVLHKLSSYVEQSRDRAFRMKDKNKTKEQLIEELAELRQRIANLERTENRREKATGKRSAEELQDIIDSIKDGIVLLDLTGKVIAINRSVTEASGYAEKDIVGKRLTLLKMFPPKSLATMFTAFTRVISGQQPPPYEVEVYTRTGEKLFVEIHGSLWKKGGAKAGVVAALRDITERKRMEETLRESEGKYRELINGMNDTAWVIDFDGKFIDVNDAAVEVLGYSREELLAMGPHDIDSSLDAESITGLIKRMRTDKIQVFETIHTTKDGKTIPVEIKSSLVTYQGKQAILSIARDITERKQVAEALRESEKRFRLLVENSKDAFVLHDLDGRIIDVNQHTCDSLGYTREELLDLSVNYIDDAAIPGKHKEKWHKMVPGEPLTLEGIHRRKDGTTFPVEVRLVAFDSGGRRLILGLVRDITERIRAEETIRRLAYHDALTDLPNRALFADRLNRAIARAHRNQHKFAVMLLDLDHFKNINDTFGHAVGDQLLSSVGKRLTGLLRQEDTVARMGGDEFFLLLPEVDRVHDAATIAQKVLKAFHEPFVLDVHELNITTSIGIAVYPDDGEAVKTLLKNVDVALYRAKQEGRNNFQHYTPAMKPAFQGKR